MHFTMSDRVAGLWSPSLELAVDFSGRGGFEGSAGVADFSLGRASLALCPSRLGQSVRVRPCAQLEGGLLRAVGRQTFAPRSADRPWVGVGASLRGSVDLVGPLSIEAGVRLVLPLIRDSFQFDEVTFHTTSSSSVSGSLGLGLRFP